MITSPHNPRVKEAIALRDRRQRRQQGLFLIDGVREMLRAIEAGIELKEAFACRELFGVGDAEVDRLLGGLQKRSVPLVEISARVFARLAYGERMEGLVAVAGAPRRELADLQLPACPLVAVLEGVEKPGNVGAVLRSAAAAGMSALILADGRTDLYNPNTIRASLGTVFTVPTCAATAAAVREWLSAKGISVFAARVDAACDYTAADFTRPAAIVLGSEAAGLSDAWIDGVTPVRLPMLGIADSLNVSVTAAVLFYEALRQRHAAPAAR